MSTIAYQSAGSWSTSETAALAAAGLAQSPLSVTRLNTGATSLYRARGLRRHSTLAQAQDQAIPILRSRY